MVQACELGSFMWGGLAKAHMCPLGGAVQTEPFKGLLAYYTFNDDGVVAQTATLGGIAATAFSTASLL